MMTGGNASAFNHSNPIFKTLAHGMGTIDKTPGHEHTKSTDVEGDLYTGPTGSANFAKLVHNGIEFSAVQAHTKGLNILQGVSQDAIEEIVLADVLAAALFTRLLSRKEHTFAEKLLCATHKQFGSHQELGKN